MARWMLSTFGGVSARKSLPRNRPKILRKCKWRYSPSEPTRNIVNE